MEMAAALVGLIGAGLQAQANANSVEAQYANLQFQRDRAAKSDWMGQAARTDMYGNTTRYDPALNKWVVDLSPDQQTIRDAQEKEQLQQLTQDAPAARKIRQAIQQRAAMAKEPFNRAAVGYQYAQPPSEESIRSELTGLMANNDMLRSKADQALIMRSALRAGSTARPQEIIQSTEQELGQGTQNRMLEARKQAMDEFGKRLQQHEVQYGTPMKAWGDLMSQGGDLPNISKGNIDQSINSMISGQSSGMAGAFDKGTSGIGSAYGGLATALQKSPDLNDLAKIIAGIGKKKADGSGDTYDMSGTGGGSSVFGPSSYSSFDDRPSEGWD